jgi:hypothetical protein
VCQQFYASGESAQFFEVKGVDERENNKKKKKNNENNRYV